MFKKMFEKFFNKKEESSIEKPLIPDFVVIPEMEELVRQYNRLGSMVFAWAHDGNLEKLELAKKDLLEAANSDMGTKLKEYLSPYINMELPSGYHYYGAEIDRYRAAVSLKN